ncbi:unnamed protein product (macronuclear) [Paramecium tetraurelia]|uniref:Kinase n=1 Tax=Paramecium tetraurelia TaxID=5888 RepID=A0EF93_PARTE|nr:uncharacterized protein GSPATT00026307001 [Paramecium tetraurelia]CAK93984.1 unnamed protein product [Paramecium tetraurelia]|eukprot:XP_001461357.1 hypothetical protein (macronuclear) [Paramecium tetraurelia strain d4-2]
MNFEQELQQTFFEQQISGHSIFIKLNDGEFVAKSCSTENNNEQIFYEWVQHIQGYQDFFSQYNGVITLKDTQVIEQPKVDQRQQKWLESLIAKRFNPNNKKYLLLENLVQRQKNLRILDIKLGFTVEKKSHIIRYQESTSSKVGLRICGMKVQENDEIIVFRDKHWGRRISVDELTEELKTFFNIQKKKMIINLTEQVEHLKLFITQNCKEVVSWQGTSLLIVSDSEDDLKIRLIDFSKAKVDKQSNKGNTDIIDSLNSLLELVKQI